MYKGLNAPQILYVAILIASEMICLVYFVKWKLLIVVNTKYTSSMYF